MNCSERNKEYLKFYPGLIKLSGIYKTYLSPGLNLPELSEVVFRTLVVAADLHVKWAAKLTFPVYEVTCCQDRTVSIC